MTELDEELELLESLAAIISPFARRKLPVKSSTPIELPKAYLPKKRFANMWSRLRCRLGFHDGREVHQDGFGVSYAYTPCKRCQK